MRHAALLAMAISLAACVTHRGEDRVEPLGEGWEPRDGGAWAARSPTVRVAAFHASMVERCVFGGTVTNLTDAPVRVTIRPAEFDVPADAMVGLRPEWPGGLQGAPIRRGDVVEVPPRGGAAVRSGEDAPHVLRFSLRPTAGPEGDDSPPRPWSPEDVVTHEVSASGVESWTPGRPSRTGDVAHYTITVASSAGEESWDFRFRTVPGPEITDVGWKQWLALPLLPLYLVLNAFGAVD